MPYVVFQISAAAVVHNGHGDDDHDKAMVMKIIRSWLLCCKSHIHCLKQKEEDESSRCSFKGDRDVVSFPACLFVGHSHVRWTWQRGRAVVQGRRGERFASRVWIHFCCGSRGRHGIACHCSSVFSSSLALEMDPDNSFIFSWVLWSLGCKWTADLSSSFSAFRKKTLKSCQGRRVSWPCLTPCHMHFHQGCIIWGKR